MKNDTGPEREQRRQRLEAMGEVAAKVAHEIRNPLGSMKLYAELLESRLSRANDAESLSLLEKVQSGLGCVERIVSDFLSFAAPARPRLGPVMLKPVIAEVEKFAVTPGVSLSFKTDVPEGLVVLGDAGMLRQAFLNLALNAAQAMPDGGAISLAARAEGDAVVVTVRDTGPGIPPDLMERIFDPFFTTRQKGSGLGLAIVSSIIALHGGTISAGAAPGGGAVFTIRLKGI